jgi:hypothetical protein
VRWIEQVRALLGQHEQMATASATMLRVVQDVHHAAIRESANSDSLLRFGFQTFSQNDEDGIILEILSRIGEGDRVFVECGVENGLETNTTHLLAQGWRGFWFEGSQSNCRQIRQRFKRELSDGRLVLTEGLLNKESTAELFAQAGVPQKIDVLSLDIDYNTSHLWRWLSAYAARLAVVEYNASFPPSTTWEVEYDRDAVWDGTLWFGASLPVIEEIGRRNEMTLVGCNVTGVNAFFVADRFVADHFPGEHSATAHYQPPRYYLSRTSGHPRGWR